MSYTIDPSPDSWVWHDSAFNITSLKSLELRTNQPIDVDGRISEPYNYMSFEQVVPTPPAVWLFGSGLLGLIGVARKQARA